MDKILKQAAEIINKSKFLTVFTGAGISKESGIPVFRGSQGLYSKYDPSVLEISNYFNNTDESWKAIKEIFYDFIGKAKPNLAHNILAEWENKGILKAVITQNIDNLHTEAGNKTVIEYHGTTNNFICTNCTSNYSLKEITITDKPPKCKKCNSLLKPDFVFFGEGIPQQAANQSHSFSTKSDVHIIIGTTGEVYPASYIPIYAKNSGAKIIEINPNPSEYTNKITDIYLPLKASEALGKLNSIISNL
ncbi:MAG: NAD-dependent deacylase [Bacteroidales bacterium]|jgi:NAD-dependent deacetylase|nr:NAD-dependent deacylase [Bacteroidales bacterium]MCK9499582.1 NAD-dependent deacylase [Bacteroidales bacterium]MDY0315535.1 NAD-dependent deacylase [Bacteroidales bacterium]NLB86717.1 NAD-dependent deacylase [Bacteroidales bacterium]